MNGESRGYGHEKLIDVVDFLIAFHRNLIDVVDLPPREQEKLIDVVDSGLPVVDSGLRAEERPHRRR